jgi:hypothetical protein
MAANISPIYPIIPVIGVATLTSATALTVRTNITGTTGLLQLTATSTNGTRIDAITVKGQGTTLASNILIFIYNGTTSTIFDEIDVTAITAAATTDSFLITKTYDYLVVPPTYQLFIAQTVQTNVNVYAMGGQY